MYLGHEIGTVVHGDNRAVIQGGLKMLVVSLVVLTLYGKHRNIIVLYKGCCYGVLGGKRVGGAEYYVSSSGLERPYQVCGLCRDMKAGRHLHPLERLLLCEPFPDNP